MPVGGAFGQRLSDLRQHSLVLGRPRRELGRVALSALGRGGFPLLQLAGLFPQRVKLLLREWFDVPDRHGLNAVAGEERPAGDIKVLPADNDLKRITRSASGGTDIADARTVLCDRNGRNRQPHNPLCNDYSLARIHETPSL